MLRRLAKVQISTELLLQWLQVGTHGFNVTSHNLPEDARIVEARVVGQTMVELTIASEEYPVVPELAEPPFAMPPHYKPRIPWHLLLHSVN